VWAETATKTEGFETATKGSTYNSTQAYTTAQSDCGIAWTMYYGTVSSDVKLAGSQSAQMRWYSSAKTNYGYIANTTPVNGLSNIAFKAKVSNVALKMEVSYSSNGTNWTVLATKTFENTNEASCSYDIPSGNKYVKIGVSSSGTAPSSGNYKLTIDNVVFSYTTHELTFSATNGSIAITDGDVTVISGSQVAEGTTLNVVASGNAGYAFDEWSVTGTGSSVANTSNASTTFNMGTANATLTAIFVEDNTEYTVTCNDASYGSVVSNVASATSGTTITLTITPSFKYHLTSLTVTDASSNTISTTKTGNNTYTFNMPGSNVTIASTFNNTYVDVLTNDLFNISGSSYTSWSSVTSNSSAVYAGNTSASKNVVQFKKATEGSGIYTIVSGGYVRNVSVTWNSNTSDKRTLKIYGSNTPFTNASNISAGTELGSIVYGTSTELDITGNYQYIGMEGSGGAIYLDEIDIEWEEATTAIVNIAAACTDGEKYYGTYSNGTDFVVPSGLTVSALKVDNDGKLVVMDYAEGDVVKANTGVLVSAATAGDKTITLSAETGIEKAGNLLKPSGDAGITAANMTEANTKFYRLTMHDGSKIGFWWGAADGAAFNLAANKAYLAVPTATAAPSFFWFGGETTAIRGIENGELRIENGVVFNLAGQRVAQPTKGLYIVNGRKVVLK